MITELAIAVAFTLLVSAFCSLLEAMILSTTTAEIEMLKQKHPRRGALLEHFHRDMEGTSSAILSLNTLANTAGASISGALALSALGEQNVKYFSAGLVLGILFFSEVIPKNLGVLYRPALQPVFVYPLYGVRLLMQPVSKLCSVLVQLVAQRKNGEDNSENADEEIMLLAKKSAQQGDLSQHESAIITNALKLDETRVSEMMTPRTVITALRADSSIEETFEAMPNLPFGRLPVYKGDLDQIVGFVRRRDLLEAKAKNQKDLQISELSQEVLFMPENATGGQALQQFLRRQQQIAIVVNEFGSVVGVLTMEDVIEHILGQEIFEKDDMAVDMRELARRQHRLQKQQQSRESP